MSGGGCISVEIAKKASTQGFDDQENGIAQD
jgi:hypothetical protein